MNWNWTDKELILEPRTAFEKRFSIVPFQKRDLELFAANLQACREIYGILSDALVAFRCGRATYIDAVNNIEHLLNNELAAKQLTTTAAKEIDAFFDPSNLSDSFQTVDDVIQLTEDMKRRFLKPKGATDGRRPKHSDQFGLDAIDEKTSSNGSVDPTTSTPIGSNQNAD